MTKVISKNKTSDIVYIGIFAAMISICSWITIPATVPFTLQTMGIFTAIGILGGQKGTLAVLTYILLGAVGIPVFSGFSGGIGIIFGTTDGYIIGFLFSAILMWRIEAIFGRNQIVFILSMISGLFVCYAFGTAWLCFQAHMSAAAGLAAGVIPYIPGDLVKIAVAMIVGTALRAALKKAR